MSPQCTIKNTRDKGTGQGFHLYEDLVQDEDCVMELEGLPFETSTFFTSHGTFDTRILLTIRRGWAHELGLLQRRVSRPMRRGSEQEN